MIDKYATGPRVSLSLPIRMEQKAKRTRGGITALSVGVALAGGAIYNFLGTGTQLIASYMTVMSLVFIGLGSYLLNKASKIC